MTSRHLVTMKKRERICGFARDPSKTQSELLIWSAIEDAIATELRSQ